MSSATGKSDLKTTHLWNSKELFDSAQHGFTRERAIALYGLLRYPMLWYSENLITGCMRFITVFLEHLTGVIQNIFKKNVGRRYWPQNFMSMSCIFQRQLS